MSTKAPELIAELDNAYGFLIERTAKIIKQHFQQVLRNAQADITVDQWVILYELYQEDGLSQFEIAQRTFKHAPSITRIIDLLCKRGFLLREMDNADRRKFNIMLTDEGRKKVLRLLPEVKAFRRQGWAGLTNNDFDKLQGLLNAISKNLGEAPGEK